MHPCRLGDATSTLSLNPVDILGSMHGRNSGAKLVVPAYAGPRRAPPSKNPAQLGAIAHVIHHVSARAPTTSQTSALLGKRPAPGRPQTMASFRLRRPQADRRTLAAGGGVGGLGPWAANLEGSAPPELHTKTDRHRPGLITTRSTANQVARGIHDQGAMSARGLLVVGLGPLGADHRDRYFRPEKETASASSYFSDITTPGNSGLISYRL
jgi:hypothetical protein